MSANCSESARIWWRVSENYWCRDCGTKWQNKDSWGSIRFLLEQNVKQTRWRLNSTRLSKQHQNCQAERWSSDVLQTHCCFSTHVYHDKSLRCILNMKKNLHSFNIRHKHLCNFTCKMGSYCFNQGQTYPENANHRLCSVPLLCSIGPLPTSAQTSEHHTPSPPPSFFHSSSIILNRCVFISDF